MIEVNLLGTITATEVFLDQLKAAAHADIVNIGSVAGRRAEPGGGVYAATKRGVNGWSESLRLELKPKIRITLIEPGGVATELPRCLRHDEAPAIRGARGPGAPGRAGVLNAVHPRAN
ncbi:SDR family NAD(P)-dependent oxidoreductase [Streptomyces sp. NBS 14/10]|uniref:SDR family oxidoreductase n=1 Tax=Streptomyces sp. NBS 14/10 TaxID=1945643 RepID=UPI000B9D042D|nr:SDR family NAD(P)-dependent oxidoreductase [Streptomyces sp. NBS 14/10]KAK1176874.1 SDR family NAD(P)-dependent oxidoreductase [Streptomyces sp. NBS 14/10]